MQENNVNENENVVDEEFDVVKEVNDLKKNSVPKEEYDRLKEEHNKTLRAIINGDVEGLELPEATTDSTDNVERIKALRNKLSNEELNNLDYVSTALELRNAVISEYGEEKDPFLPTGHNVVIEQSDIDTANRVADTLQDLVEKANGDSQYFTNELSRITVEGKRPNNIRKK